MTKGLLDHLDQKGSLERKDLRVILEIQGIGDHQGPKEIRDKQENQDFQDHQDNQGYKEVLG